MASSAKKWIFAGIAACLLLLLLLTGGLASLLLTAQKDFPAPELTPADWACQSRVLMREMQQLMQADPNRPREVKLTPEEVSAFLKMAANHDQVKMLDPGNGAGSGVPWTLTYDTDGLFHAAILAETPFGSLRCLLQASFRLSYADNKFTITPVRCSAGHITIPNRIIEENLIPRLLAQLDSSSEIQLFHSIVESIRQDQQNCLIFSYIPANAKVVGASLF